MDMFFRCVLVIIMFATILFFVDVLLPKIKLKHRLRKEEKIRKSREEKFKNMMKELEIK